MVRLLFPILKKFSLKIFLRLEQLKDNKNALSSIESRLLGGKFCCQRRRCCYTTAEFVVRFIRYQYRVKVITFSVAA